MSDPALSTDPRIGSRLGARYVLDARIASGGMAVVYRAIDEVLGRHVAVKVMHPALAADPGFVERFRGEAQNAARLNHANIAMVHDWGAEDNTVFMVMELVEGTSLREMLEACGRFDPHTTRGMVTGIASALDHAHERGIVHRDIKPENIMVTTSGAVKVVDFGVAKALGPGAVRITTEAALGTVAYIAPEQLTGQPVDARTDVYALGIMAYEMLTGLPAFMGDTPSAVAAARLSGSVPSPGVDPSTDAAVAKATAIRPDDRFRSAGEFASALGVGEASRGFNETAEVPIAPPSAMPTTVLPVVKAPKMRRSGRRAGPKRNSWKLPLTLLIVTALVAAGLTAYRVQPWMATVPDVTRASAEQASAALRSAGFTVAGSDVAFSDDVPEGGVVATKPAMGNRARRGTTVALIVSRGPEMLALSSVGGKTLDEATALLKTAGFELGEVKHEFSTSVPKDHVVSQDPSPDAGTQRRGTTVNVTVSKGPDLVAVPDVSARTPAEAKSGLEAAGFVYSRAEDWSETAAPDTILRIEPAAGKLAVRGSKVKVVVSKGPRPFPMPELIGMSLSEAKSKAQSLGLVVSNTYAVPGSGKAKNTVQGQNPPPGTDVRKGAKIDLYYAA